MPTLRRRKPVTFTVAGTRLDGATPRWMADRTRAVAGPSAFLPPGLVSVREAIGVVGGARAAVPSATRRIDASPGDVVALELDDGITVVTNAARLADTLEELNVGRSQHSARGAKARPSATSAPGSLEILNTHASTTRDATASVGSVAAARGLISRVFVLNVGNDEIVEDARRKTAELMGGKAGVARRAVSDLGLSWAGTKALMWAIENRLDRKPGLYRWVAGRGEPADLADISSAAIERDAATGPLLIFIHGTASNTHGSFGHLRTSAEWSALEARFADRILALEHRTFSESPIENALQLARALPAGARFSLVTHSRGGLVGDLLCVDPAAAEAKALVEGFGPLKKGDAEVARAYREHRERLRELLALLRQKQFVIARYVRVGSPARGTRLLSSNLDVFLSGLSALVSIALPGQPIVEALRRIVLEVARNRADPRLVPGIEAMLPESPMGRLLALARARPIEMAVIAGDIEGGGLLKRLGAVFTDHLFFDALDNDLVVDSDSMAAGIARPESARAMFDRGPDVNHFRYFSNERTRGPLCRWLTEQDSGLIADFGALDVVPTVPAESAARRTARWRGVRSDTRPVVVVLPGIMGSYLKVNDDDRVWFDFADLAAGGLGKIRWGSANVDPEILFPRFYGDLCEFLATSHRVEAFAYDWRLPLDVLAGALEKKLRSLLDANKAPAVPIRVLAHSMGGLVARAVIRKSSGLWDEVMGREGARFVMLGTPNQGSHLMVASLLGKADTMRQLAHLDPPRGLQGVLDIVGEFRGALQLLPRPGFVDEGAGDAFGARYYDPACWRELKPLMKDSWFGDGIAALPGKTALTEGRWLWTQDGEAPEISLPQAHAAKTLYVHGCAASTPCGITTANAKVKLLATPRGDGSVTWRSGKIGGVRDFYFMPAEHSDLTGTPEYFPAIDELLRQGTPGALTKEPPTVRGLATDDERLTVYDAGPPLFPTDADIAGGLFGTPRRPRRPARMERLEVAVRAMDVRYCQSPILVGHFDGDAIAGVEAIVDRDVVDGELSSRLSLGMYAGPLGTATVVLLARNSEERLRRSHRGAVVAGLGTYDGTLSASTLTEAVRLAALRYLLQMRDTRAVDSAPAELLLSTLLLGYNSTATLTIADSLTALVRGVTDANRKFGDMPRGGLRIAKLEIVERYLDTAITAAHELKRVAADLNRQGELGCEVRAAALMRRGRGALPRLKDSRTAAYWPRLIVTDADARDGRSTPNRDGARADLSSAAADTPPIEPTTPRPAERLRFVYVGQRARAEMIYQRRQPGLIEGLMAAQLPNPNYDADFGRALFQLLVPHELKEAARNLQSVVLVVDDATGIFPWELMQADERPLAVGARMVRQLATGRFRQRIRQSRGRHAYVVGNPSTEGFGAAFSPRGAPKVADPDDLPAAEAEARTTIETLVKGGFEVESAVGTAFAAMDIIATLYKHPYRIVHIAGHGISHLPAKDGSRRTGVVLSDGLCITAAEIGAMEEVPDLVFLNCCHLGVLERAPENFDRLSYSLAQALTEIGVRGVVVAGWAVDDRAAEVFARTFYEGFVGANLPFGDAVFAAREVVHGSFPASTTWGAYQAYGEPSWQFGPGGAGASLPARLEAPGDWVAVEELLVELLGIAEAARGRGGADSDATRRRLAAKIKSALERAPEAWRMTPAVQAAAGRAYSELGIEYFETARQLYVAALGLESAEQPASVVIIEQLANLEARIADDDSIESTRAEALIDAAILRIDSLLALAASGESTPSAPAPIHRERNAIRASAYKCKAALLARTILRGDIDTRGIRQLEDALVSSRDAYELASGSLGDPAFDSYSALNALFLRALPLPANRASRFSAADDKAIADECTRLARESFALDPGFWNATIPADVMLAQRVADRSLASAAGYRAVVDEIVQTYRDAMQDVAASDRERDSAARQMHKLARFIAALSKDPKVAARCGTTAKAIDELIARLWPERQPRPAPGAKRASGAKPKATGKSKAAARTRKRTGARRKAARTKP